MEAVRGGGRPARVYRATFGSQQEQVVFINELAKAYRSKVPIRQLAIEIVRAAGVPPKAKAAQAAAIGRWAQENLYYVNEPDETFATPLRILEDRFEDCDGFTLLIITLCQALGISTEAVAIGISPFASRNFIGWFLGFFGTGLSHIFPRAIVPMGGRLRRLPLDATLSLPMGTDPVKIAGRRGNVRVFAV